MRLTRPGPTLLLLLAALVAGVPATAAVPAPVLQTNRQGVPTLAPLVAAATPAVVNISVVSRGQSSPLLRDPFFRRFFDLPESEPRREEAAGSGVIVDARNGYVVTNHHVVAESSEVFVTLKDRRRLKARLVGSDPAVDIAVLQVEAEGLAALRLGDSDQLAVGDFVLAIGNPFGIGQTVTSGIVSALGRTGLMPEGYEDFIQTDAAINPGNSGGALIDLRGELVGINTAIIGPAGGNVGIGFAVPATIVRAVVDQIVRHGEVRRGRVGVTTQELTPELAQAMAVPVTQGAVVTNVQPGSPAARAGLRRGDVIVAANGRALRGSADLRVRVGLVPVGESVALDILREGRRLNVSVQIAGPQSVEVDGRAVPELEGASVAELQPGMPLHGRIPGAVVARVQPGSPAYRRGLRAGDVILAVNRRRVDGVESLLAALRAARGGPLVLQLVRGDYTLRIPIR